MVVQQSEVDRRSGKAWMREHIEAIGLSLRELKLKGGFRNLREMATATGVPRSTLHHIMTEPAPHKTTGLTTKTLERLMQSKAVTDQVRKLIACYSAEKDQGLFGHKVPKNRVR